MAYLTESYEAVGYAILRAQIPADLVEVARREAYAQHETHGGRFGALGVYDHQDGTHWHRRRVHGLPAIAPILQHLPVRELLGPGPCGVTHSKFSYKRAGEQQSWAHHQDAAYKPEPRRGVVFAVPLEPVDESNGTLEVLLGSHLLGPLPHQVSPEMAQQLELVEPVAGEFLPLVAQPGDVAAFSLLTVHRSGPNRSHGLRAILFVEVEPLNDRLEDELGGAITVI